MKIVLLICAAVAAVMLVLVLRRWRAIQAVAPELRKAALWLPINVSPFLRAQVMKKQAKAPPPVLPDGITMAEHFAPSRSGDPDVRVLAFERADRDKSAPKGPAMLWIHGGGYVIGRPEQDVPLLSGCLQQMDIPIFSVNYRLAPEHPFPAPLDDCYAALCWLVENADALGVDPARIAIGGQSAGGGLAAGLIQRAVDVGPVMPLFQLLMYPMLDAATTARADDKGTGAFIWTAKSNVYGWKSYLGRDPRTGPYPPYAVPSARDSLAGLPPAWIGVGALDLFHTENVTYAQRLADDGVRCELLVIDGAYHGFDLMQADAPASKAFQNAMWGALKTALFPA